MANGRVIVPPPAFTPSQYGLLSVAQDRTADFDGFRWTAGITYQPLCSGTDSTFDECLVVTGIGASPEPATKSATFVSQRRAATPFTVIARKDCSAPTFWNNAPDEVNRALIEGEGWQVERAFWTGNVDSQSGINHPHLAADTVLLSDLDTLQSAASVVTGAPVDIVEGLGLLEQALANCYQGQGVIHVPASLGPALSAWGLIELVGDHYVTTNGNLVALGRGYTGSSPSGSLAATTQWIYATGAVFYARGPLRDFTRVEGFDRASNTLTQLAERTYLVGWDCCHLAVPVNLAATVAGISSGGGSGPSTNVAVTNFPATQPVSGTVASTVADGADVTEGAIADAAVVTNAPGTVSAKLRGAVSLLFDMKALLTLQNPTVLFAKIDTAASGSTQLVAAQATNKIRVLNYVVDAEGTVAVDFRSGATSLTGSMPLVINSGISAAGDRFGVFETVANQALNINLTAAVGVRGHIAYMLV